MRRKLIDQMLDLKDDLIDRCDICGGVGSLSDNEECECRVIQRYLNLLIESKIPSEFWELSFDDLTEIRPEEIVAVAKHYVDRLKVATNKSLGLLFMGPNGRGKTSLQCAIGKDAVVQGYNVQYFTAQQYIEASKAKDSELLAEYESGQIILFDELDKVYIAQKSTFVAKTLEEFLRRMISGGVAFVICTNLVEEELTTMFGDSTMSMLRGHLRFIAMAGNDYRKTQSSDWLSRLEEDLDYHNNHIVTNAYALRDREQQEDERVWEKAYRD